VSASTYWISWDAEGAALNELLRSRILSDIVDLCFSHDWDLSAAHVRPNRVETVITTNGSPQPVYRALRHLLCRDGRRWAASSPRLLRRSEREPAIQAAVRGDLMAVFVAGV
jgi:hypothetical protein